MHPPFSCSYLSPNNSALPILSVFWARIEQKWPSWAASHKAKRTNVHFLLTSLCGKNHQPERTLPWVREVVGRVKLICSSFQCSHSLVFCFTGCLNLSWTLGVTERVLNHNSLPEFMSIERQELFLVHHLFVFF